MTVNLPPIETRFSEARERKTKIVYRELGRLPETLAEAGLDPGVCIVITDKLVANHYGERLEVLLQRHDWRPRRITIPFGEQAKSLETYRQVLQTILDQPLLLSSPIIALGGGVVNDLAAFSAATIYQGIPLVQVPTTLLAQVDGALGGRATINHRAGKNMIGVFYQPELVHTDLSTLLTLPEQTYLEGMSEVVKYALVADRELFDSVIDVWDDIVDRKLDVVGGIVRRCNEVKMRIVQEDEEEMGLRAILNFGLNYGHAIEQTSNYDGISHAGAVALGLRATLKLSSLVNKGFDPSEALELVNRLPVPQLTIKASVAELVRSMESARVKVGGQLVFILLDEIGKPNWTTDVDPDLIGKAWYYALSEAKSSQSDSNEIFDRVDTQPASREEMDDHLWLEKSAAHA